MVKNKIKFSLKEKIIRYLIENNEKNFSIKQISESLKVDYKNVFNSINNLLELISKEKIGNTNIIKINLIPNELIYSVENKRKAEFLFKYNKLKLIEEDIQLIHYPFLIVLIFGSYAKNTESKNSDIDICIVSDNKTKIRNLISKLNLLPLALEIHEFSFQEFESMLKTRESNLAHEIIKNNIILFGIENYYHLISKWMKKE